MINIKELKKYIKEYKDLLNKEEIDIFSTDIREEVMIVALNKLNDADKALILLYSELKSYRKLSKELNISHQTIKNEICRIKEEIKNNINKLLEIYDK